MTRLLRKVSRDAWAEAATSPLWAQNDCPPEMLSEVFDKRGLSMWQVEDDSEIPRLIAAQVMMQSSISDEFSYVLVERKLLEDANIKIIKSPAKTLDKVVNELHVDVIEVSGLALIKLAKLIFENGEVRVMRKPEIINEIKARIGNNSFDKGALFSAKRKPAEIEASKTLIVDSWKVGRIAFV
jgi:hypothetical protein